MTQEVKGNFVGENCVSFEIGLDVTITHTLHHRNYRPEILSLLKEMKKPVSQDYICNYLVNRVDSHRDNYLRYVRETLEFLIQENKIKRQENKTTLKFSYSLN